MTKQIDKYEGLRIYTVVPGTVQTPIKITYTPKSGNIYSFGRFENTRDIVQPAGRQFQQGEHAARMVEHEVLLQEIEKGLPKWHGAGKHDHTSNFKGLKGKALREAFPYHPITGIVLACRDSFELLHIRTLLENAGIDCFEFRDTQEDLYEDVATALATEPVTPFAVAGILDYLPLWGRVNS